MLAVIKLQLAGQSYPKMCLSVVLAAKVGHMSHIYPDFSTPADYI